MKLKDIFKSNDGYAVVLVKARTSDGMPEDIESKVCCKTYEEAVREREKLSGMDVMVCPPFQYRDISPAETADYFRSYFGINSDS